ncbi:MAG TPA: M36 family metallopeptidase, partial [Solirubrobacteraceae bacterium]|nr:M36 family metallopeptidase [Solirubrobacteraceae bacterium]
GLAGGDRSAVALDWLRANRAALGLDASDVDGLALTERVVAPASRITHLRYAQRDRGIPAFDGGVRVSLDRGGRILSVAGSPLPGLEAPAVVPALDAVAALRSLQRDVGAVRSVDVVSGPDGARRVTRFAGGDFARLVLFGGPRATRLAWHLTYRAGSLAHYDAVVDAADGAILYRQNLVRHASDAQVFPSHPAAGAQVTLDLEDAGWIAPTTNVLSGPYARAYSDFDGDDAVSPAEEITRTAGSFVFPFDDFPPAGGCTAQALCSWDPGDSNSWEVNRKQNGVQAFYLVNRFHDHLAGDLDIGFTDATDGFSGGDAVRVETDDGAENLPDGSNRNNATMATPPDGSAPRMQLFLFSGAGFRNVNGGDSAAVVWHEYTHGLSNRLVTYGDGSGALSGPQSAAMGEGWSDWYALDLMAGSGLLTDDPAVHGQLNIGHYVDATPRTLRTQGIDCPAGVIGVPACPRGGFTLGDFGSVASGPEVHADGEIWAATLWDLRAALGRDLAQRLITDGMRMSPPEPSFLDMRNAILAAEAGIPGNDRTAVWEVFRKRGMGYFAHAEDGSDTSPVEDFNAPPAPGASAGRTTGTVTSADTGLPLSGVSVGFAGLSTDTVFSERLVARTASNGGYALDAPSGVYGELAFEREGGYDRVAVPAFAVAAGGSRVQDVALRRDWAASAGGAEIASRSDDTGAPFGCGAAELIDQSRDTGWSAWNPLSPHPNNPELGTPRVTIELPAAIDVAGIGLDPTNACGNSAGASTAGFRVETSTGGAFTTALEGTFGPAHRGRLNLYDVRTSGVRFVRLTLLSSQAPGSNFIDFSELEVFGGPPNRLPTGSLAASRLRVGVGDSVDFAASFTDLDSRITGYDWDFDGDGAVDRSTAGASTSFTYGRAGSFEARVAARDFRGGAGTAARTIAVARAARPVVSLPRRGSRGRLTVRVTCALRCTVRGTVRVNRRIVRRVRSTVTTTSTRRITVRLPKRVRRAVRRRGARTVRATVSVTARYADGRRDTARRTVRVRL